MFFGRKSKSSVHIEWKHGLVISATAWVVLMVLCALPYFLSGHYLSYLDATYDVMSGFTTTGLTLSQDIDHMSLSLNVWRHVITFVGGQGVVVLALSFLYQNTHGAYKIYVGEAKDIELVPSVIGTARIIWFISIIYMFIGTLLLGLEGLRMGLSPHLAFYHGFFVFASAWSTGGFAAMSQNILFYHSFNVEMITLVFMILGSFNFGLHYTIWKGNHKEIFKNIEVQSFVITLMILSVLLIKNLMNNHLYTSAVIMFRKGIYTLISAHTTTGYGTLYSRQFITDWGEFGIVILILAMLIGGSSCSTAGGIKGLRVGIFAKALVHEVRLLLRSERQIFVSKYHHIKDIAIDDKMIKATMLIIICYFLSFITGVSLGCYYGYPLLEAIFEAASITGNVGLSIGITSATMPMGYKIYSIVAMYLGRLEFLSAFALLGYILGGVKYYGPKLFKTY